MWEPPTDHPLRRLFAGLAEHAFITRLGVADPPLIDYLSGLLSRFVHTDGVHRLRGDSGRPLTELAAMAAEAEGLPPGRTRREYFRHVGDFALFWTGVYPEALNRPGGRRRDDVVDYTLQGKRGYLITSRIEEADAHPAEAGLFRRLSEEFEVCAVGLREVRREWEELRAAAVPDGRLIR